MTDATEGRLESRQVQGTFRAELEQGGSWSLDYTRQYEFLESEFPIAEDVVIPVGGEVGIPLAGVAQVDLPEPDAAP